MNRPAQTALLFLLGATLLHAGLTDLYLRYVKAGLRPLVLLAGVVLIATAAATLWYERRRARGQRQDRHHHHEPRISWLLTLPVLTLILVSPPALGSYSAVHTGTALTKPFGFPDLPAGEPLRLGVADYAGRAVYDNARSLRGRQLKITGFVTLDRAGTPYLVLEAPLPGTRESRCSARGRARGRPRGRHDHDSRDRNRDAARPRGGTRPGPVDRGA